MPDDICGCCEHSILTGKDTIYCAKHNYELNIFSRCDGFELQTYNSGVYEFIEATSDRREGVN